MKNRAAITAFAFFATILFASAEDATNSPPGEQDWNFHVQNTDIVQGYPGFPAKYRPDDTFGLAGVLNGISKVHQEFLAAGGAGILAGDGQLNYGWEKILETYYDFQIWKTIHAALDYQFITDPAFNRDRGPVSVFGARLHWEF